MDTTHPITDIPTEDLLRELAQVRLHAFDQSDIMKSLLDSVKSTPAYQTAEKLRAAYEQQEQALYDEITRRAVEQFDGKNKHPWQGVAIQEKTVATCTDLDQARKYAFEYLPGALTINMTMLNKAAVQLSSTPHALPFYQVEKRPAATIASNLTCWLPVKEDEIPSFEVL